MLPVDDYSYAASQIPDENDLAQFPVRYGKVADPDGYIVELREGPVRSNPLCKAVLNVLDLNESSAFLADKLGMKQLRKRSNLIGKPREASMSSYMVRQ